MSEYSRFSAQAKRILKVIGDILEGAVASGNRRQVVVRNKRSETLFKVSLTLVVLVGLALFFFASRFVIFVIVALVIAYYFGYRAVILRTGSP